MGEEFRTKILEKLKEQNKTQRELAKELNITPVNLNRYINGNRIANPNTLLEISKNLQVSIEYLIDNNSKTNYNSIMELINNTLTPEEKSQLKNEL